MVDYSQTQNKEKKMIFSQWIIGNTYMLDQNFSESNIYQGYYIPVGLANNKDVTVGSIHPSQNALIFNFLDFLETL